MHVLAWCGICGGSFALSQVQGGNGRCPRCGEPLAPEYTTVFGDTVRQLLTAANALQGAIRQLHAVAPPLHVDSRSICADLDIGTDS